MHLQYLTGSPDHPHVIRAGRCCRNLVPTSLITLVNRSYGKAHLEPSLPVLGNREVGSIPVRQHPSAFSMFVHTRVRLLQRKGLLPHMIYISFSTIYS
jgi:hypothetical protein